MIHNSQLEISDQKFRFPKFGSEFKENYKK